VFYKTEAVIDLFFSNESGHDSNESNCDDSNCDDRDSNESDCDSNLNIIDFIKSLKSIMKYVCIKVPNNYNFSALYSAFYKITIYRLNGFYFVLLII
jgi:hypothetical protein